MNLASYRFDRIEKGKVLKKKINRSFSQVTKRFE